MNYGQIMQKKDLRRNLKAMDNILNKDQQQELFDYMMNEHNVTLLDSEMHEIENIFIEAVEKKLPGEDKVNEQAMKHSLDKEVTPVNFIENFYDGAKWVIKILEDNG